MSFNVLFYVYVKKTFQKNLWTWCTVFFLSYEPVMTCIIGMLALSPQKKPWSCAGWCHRFRRVLCSDQRLDIGRFSLSALSTWRRAQNQLRGRWRFGETTADMLGKKTTAKATQDMSTTMAFAGLLRKLMKAWTCPGFQQLRHGFKDWTMKYGVSKCFKNHIVICIIMYP